MQSHRIQCRAYIATEQAAEMGEQAGGLVLHHLKLWILGTFAKVSCGS